MGKVELQKKSNIAVKLFDQSEFCSYEVIRNLLETN